MKGILAAAYPDHKMRTDTNSHGFTHDGNGVMRTIVEGEIWRGDTVSS